MLIILRWEPSETVEQKKNKTLLKQNHSVCPECLRVRADPHWQETIAVVQGDGDVLETWWNSWRWWLVVKFQIHFKESVRWTRFHVCMGGGVSITVTLETGKPKELKGWVLTKWQHLERNNKWHFGVQWVWSAYWTSRQRWKPTWRYQLGNQQLIDS